MLAWWRAVGLALLLGAVLSFAVSLPALEIFRPLGVCGLVAVWEAVCAAHCLAFEKSRDGGAGDFGGEVGYPGEAFWCAVCEVVGVGVWSVGA